jgi:putative ABC transport system substrate-binding protein
VPFRRGLADLGYIEGQTIVIEWRGDAGRAERLSENVAELLALDLDLIVAVGEPRARAAKDATSTIPIVLSAGVDPIGAGLIESFNRPGGNVTGVIESLPQLHGKQLELLRALSPGMTRVTVLSAGGGSGGLLSASRRQEEIEVSGRALGLELRVRTASTAEALAEVLSREAGERPEAVLVVHSGFMSSQRQQIFDFAARTRLPVMFGSRLYVEAGGLAAYGPDLLAIHYRAAAYVDKILKGANPAELSVELPTKLDFSINLKAAQAIGITIPQSVLQQATEVIQ